MIKKETQLSHEPAGNAPRRYQVYRQSKNGCHYNHGDSTDSAENAVALFLNTAPAFDGGDVRLWDHHEMRAVASAEWHVETTHMGFLVRTRSNAFHDEPLAAIAQNIAQKGNVMPSKNAQSAMPTKNTTGAKLPVQTFRLGRIKVAVWENEADQKKFNNVTFARTYTGEDKQPHDTDSFGRDDLPLVAKLADQAHTFIFSRLAELKADAQSE